MKKKPLFVLIVLILYLFGGCTPHAPVSTTLPEINDPTIDHTIPVGTQVQETEPNATPPVDTEPGSSAPEDTPPQDTEPGETEPVETEPVGTKPVETEPIETEPTETTPGNAETVVICAIYASHSGEMIPAGTNIEKSHFTVIAEYSNGTTAQLADFNISPTIIDTAGKYDITVTYNGMEAIVTVSVIHANDPNANPASDFNYKIQNNSVTINGYIGTSESVIIPAIIEGKPVTRIHAFDCAFIKNVIIPDSVTNIDRKAFADCQELQSVTVGASIKELGDNIFYQLQKLKNVEIKNGVTIIGDSMFSYCPSIETIIIPNSVKTIANGAFEGNTSLKLLKIGNNVEYIGASAFSGCTSIQEVTIPNSVKTLGRHAFSGCFELLRVTVGNGLSEIGDNVFYQCKKLADVTLNEGLSILGSHMFSACAITEIYIPESVSEIPWDDGWDDPFSYCSINKIYVKKGSYADEWCQNTDYADLLAYS